MPYVRENNVVYKRTNGLTKKGSSKTPAKAEAYRRLLEMIHRGGKPTRAK